MLTPAGYAIRKTELHNVIVIVTTALSDSGRYISQSHTLVQCSAVSRRFLAQISAQNLSQILNVWVKVCTKQTKKARICNKTLFATKARICQIAAWTCNNWHDPCNMHEKHACDHKKIVNIV